MDIGPPQYCPEDPILGTNDEKSIFVGLFLINDFSFYLPIW